MGRVAFVGVWRLVRLLLLLLAAAAPRGVQGDFNADAVKLAIAKLRNSLEQPEMQSTILQDGFRSQFLYNDSRVLWSNVGSLLFSQIRSLQKFGTYYHLWTGFEDGAFLGYYDKGGVISGSDPNFYTISWQSSYNHSCDYNVTVADWKSKLDVPRSGLGYPGWPSRRADKMRLDSYCREFFHAKKDDGKLVNSIKGQAYDCRMRGWYFSVKRNLQKQWSGVYVDRSTNEVAVALCIPLFNSSASTGRKDVRPARILPDANGLIGVACTGLYLSDISENLAQLFPDFEANAIYVQERSSGYLIAVSTTHREAFYDIATKSRIYSLQSPDPLIAWSARMLVKFNNGSWPTSPVTIVRDVNETIHPPRKYQNLSSLVTGRSYYISTQLFTSNGLEWDMVSLQAVNCPHIYERGCTHDRACTDRELECVKCEQPWTSKGGASRCDICETGYYESLEGTCKRCSKGTICEEPGITIETLPVKKGFYRFADDAKGIYKCEHNKMDCTGNGNCSAASEGPFCATCVDGFFFDVHEARCLDCDSYDMVGIIVVVLMIVVLPVVLIVCCCCTASKNQVNAMLTTLSTDDNQEAVDLVVTPLVRLQRKLKLLYTYFQIVASFEFNLSIVYPAPFSQFLTWLSVFNLDFLGLLPLECAIRGMDFASSLVFYCMMPLILSAILLLLHQWELQKEKVETVEKAKAEAKEKERKGAIDARYEKIRRQVYRHDAESDRIETNIIEEAVDYHENESAAEHHFDPMQVLELATRVSLHSTKDTEAKKSANVLLSARRKTAKGNGEGCAIEVKLAHNKSVWWFHDWEVDELCRLVLVEERKIRQEGSQTLEERHMQGLAQSMANHAASKRKIVKDQEKRNDHYFQGFLLLTYIVLPMVSSQVFMSFRCDTYNVGEELGGQRRYLSIDPSIECAGARYNNMLFFASVMIAIYPFGIPFLYFILLMRCYGEFFPPEEQDASKGDVLKHGPGFSDEVEQVKGETAAKNKIKKQSSFHGAMDMTTDVTTTGLKLASVVRHELAFGMRLVTSDMAVKLQDDEKKEYEWAQITANHKLSFLLGPYERRCYWYEVIECFRRLSLSGLLVTFGPGSNRQIAVGIFLCLFFIRVSAYFNALRLDEDDILNEFCSWQLFFILFLTLLLKVDAAPPGVGAVLLGTAIFSFIAVLGLFGYLGLLRIYLSVHDARKRRAEGREAEAKAKAEAEAKKAEGGQGDAERGGAGERGGEAGASLDAAETQPKTSVLPKQASKVYPRESFGGEITEEFLGHIGLAGLPMPRNDRDMVLTSLSEDGGPEPSRDAGGKSPAAAAAVAAAVAAAEAEAAKAVDEAEEAFKKKSAAMDDGTIYL